MRRGTGGVVVLLIFVLVFVLFWMITKGHAASSEESFTAISVSLPMGADVAGMGNIGTLEGFSSSNPAVTSIMKEGKMSGTVNYGNFQFEKTRLETISGSVTGKVGDAILQVAFGHGESPSRWISDSQKYKIKNNTIDLQAGGNVARGMLFADDELYVGIGYAFTESVQSSTLIIPTPSETFIDDVVMDSQSHGATLGFAYKPIKEITIGAFGSRIWNSSRMTVNGWSNEEVFKSFNDVAHAGASAKVFELTTVAADYKRLSFSDSSTTFDQFYVGIEQYLIKDVLALYVGDANGGLTAGLGIYFKNGGLNLSYGHDMLKETKEYLGKADAYMASAYFNF